MRTFLVVLSFGTLLVLMACGAPSLGGPLPIEASTDDHPILMNGEGGSMGEAGAPPPPEAGYGDVMFSPCSPVSVTSFTPTYNLPVAHTGACSPAQIDAVVSDCLGPTSAAMTSACASWQADTKNSGCDRCLAGYETDTSWAPILLAPGGQEILLDFAGCIALADPSQLNCAEAFEYLIECDVAACVAACPIPVGAKADSPEVQALTGCIKNANVLPSDAGPGGGCSMYYTNAKTCAESPAFLGKSPASFCLGLQDSTMPSAADLKHFLTLSCGPAPPAPDSGMPPPAIDGGTPHDGP